MAEAKKKTEVAKAKDAQNKQLAAADAFEEMDAVGFEEADADAYAIPFLAILQSNSPQCKRSEGEYIKGAEEGMLFNTVTRDIYNGDDGLEIVPVHYQRVFAHWVPRDEGGGFLGEMSVDDPRIQEAEREGSRLVDKDGNYIVDTRKHYVIVKKPDGEFEPMLITMSSTQLKKSRQIMTRLRNLKLRNSSGKLFTPPMFASFFKMVTVPESNKEGSWYGWKPEWDTLQQLDLQNDSDAELFQAAKDFREAILGGLVQEQQPEAPAQDEDDVGY